MKKLQTSPKMHFYTILPIHKISKDEVKFHAENRLKIFKCIEGNQEPVVDNNDVISHFCALLVCSQLEWTRIYFTNNETNLFKKQLHKYPLSEIKRFFYQDFLPNLSGCFIENDILFITHEAVYQPFKNHNSGVKFNTVYVYFTKIIDLVSKRSVFPVNGYCLLNDDMLISVLTSGFRKYIEHRINQFPIDERIFSITQELFTRSQATSTLKNIEDKLPPCIAGIISILGTNRHLKYNDRQTLSLFLKEAGISVDECIEFFRSHFSCTREHFDKEYLYNLRHNYGLEGKRANYQSYNCHKIAKNTPAFGCPYISQQTYVKKFWEEKNVIADIEDLNFQVNCARNLSKFLGDEIQNIVSPIDYLKKMLSSSKDNV